VSSLRSFIFAAARLDSVRPAAGAGVELVARFVEALAHFGDLLT
jgi:hypothetical protein